jgi:hypothetical protein
MKLSPRADRVWQRMEQIFGDNLRVMHPNGMSEAMAQVVDRVDDQAIKDGLARIKQMRRPPNLREFSEAMDSMPKPLASPDVMGRLVTYAMKNLNLSEAQYTRPWTWLYEGDSRPGTVFFAIKGVKIPGDPDRGRAEIVLPVDVLS